MPDPTTKRPKFNPKAEEPTQWPPLKLKDAGKARREKAASRKRGAGR